MTESSAAEFRCSCNDAHVPLCALCHDDIYCPQCGDKIVEIQSRLQRPERGVVWVYANEGQFELPVELIFGDRDRQRRSRIPILALSDSKLTQAQGFFSSEVSKQSLRSENEVGIRLCPTVTAGQAPHYSALPANGLDCVLHLVGEFGSQDLDVKLCRAPRLSIVVQGEGLHLVRSSDSDADEWSVLSVDVTRPAPRAPITISLEATDAPVFLDDDIRDYNFDDEDRRFPHPILKGAVLSVGQPVELQLEADLQSLLDGVPKVLGFWIMLVSVPALIDITFQRAELGEVEFSVSAFRRDRMMFGEVFPGPGEPPFWLRNVGGADLLLSPPEIRNATGPEGVHWIRTSWPGVGRQEPVRLKKNEKRDLNIDIDLTGLNRSNHDGSSLRATVALADDKQRLWELLIVINQLVEPPVFEHPLCIDFGNTNSCTATKNPGGPGYPSLDIDVATLTTPAERFPTAVLFTDVRSDPPKVLIGEQAVEHSKKFPAATLITGLKRQIGKGISTTVWDTQSQEHEFSYSQLVEIYLGELIRQSEARLKQQFREIAISYPVKFSTDGGRDRLEDFKEIIQSTANNFQRVGVVSDGPAFRVSEYLDEASCVCYGFVLDKQNSERLLDRLRAKREDSPDHDSPDHDTQTLTIASIDFGGGSIDTAILRFQYTIVGTRTTGIRSELLFSGGDAAFGGDNVTVAVFECLCLRLEELLRGVTALGFQRVQRADPTSRGYHGAAPAERANYQRLWDVAELLKRYLCNAAVENQDPAQDVEQEPAQDAERVPAGDAFRELVEQMRVILGDLVAEFDDGSGRSVKTLRESEASQRLGQWLDEGRLHVSLDEIYAHRVSKDLRGEGGYTVAERIERCVNDLRDAALQRQAPIDYLVLAGASCRVPLVVDLVKSVVVGTFEQAQWEYDVLSAKSKVATGLARFWPRRQALRTSAPGEQLPFELGLWFPAFDDYVCIIRRFTRIVDQTWFPLAAGDFKAALSNDESRLTIYRRHKTERGWKREVHGYFCLRPPADEPLGKQELPDNIPVETQAQIRLDGSLHGLELALSIQGVSIGYWRWTSGPEPDGP